MVFKLFACCIPVDGARRSVVCDIQRGNFRFISNILFEILTVHKDKPLDEIKAAYENEHDEDIDSYFNFLEEHDFGFWCENPQEFPDLDLTFRQSSEITNAIIDVNEESCHDFQSLSAQLDTLGCEAVQVRIFHETSADYLRSIADAFSTGRLNTLEFIARYSADLNYRNLSHICQHYQRVHNVIIHSAPFTKKTNAKGIATPIIYTGETIKDHSFCGAVHPTYFVVNIPGFLESKHVNNCLSRKIGIDADGNIKNCPSMKTSYGNTRDTPLKQAIAMEGFRSSWNTTKDHVNICKDCEFRYICPDCRVYTENGEPLGKPAKCKYDPYTASWQA